MPTEHNPIHRRIIIPWYDSDTACVVLMILMVPVLLFGICGISVSHEAQGYHRYGWVAVLLTGLSGWVILSAGFRLMLRLIGQRDADL